MLTKRLLQLIICTVQFAIPITQASAQQLIPFTTNIINLEPLNIQGNTYPNQTFSPESIGANALGQSIATGAGSVALGASSQAVVTYPSYPSSLNSVMSYDIGAVATGQRSIGIGSLQGGPATLTYSTCNNTMGMFPTCTGQATVTLGATANDAIAIGTAASASFNNSTAFGLNAATSRQNQQTFGTSISNYTLSGLTTGGNFQTGTAYMVTTDAVGNLGYTAMPSIGTNPCDTATQTGANAIGCGNGATASGISSSAYGQNANASATNSVALGAGATAGIANSVAIGSNSITANSNTGQYTINGGNIAGSGALGGTVSVGSLSAERQIQNVAAGVVNSNSTDAINGSQLYAVGSQVNTNTVNISSNTSSINSLNTTVSSQQNQITTNTNDIATNTSDIGALNMTVASQGAQINTNTNSIATNTANLATAGNTIANAFGGGSTYTPTGGVTAPHYVVDRRSYNNVGTAIDALNNGYNALNNSLGSLGNATMTGLTNAYGQIINNQKEARQGIAMAAALAQAPMPSAPGKTSWKFNNAVYKNAAATSFSIAHRLPTRVPVAVTAGVAIGLRNSVIVTGGMQGEF